MASYPWYDVADGDEPLSQGDFVDLCPIVIPPATIESETVPADIKEYNVVIMSQSCDLWYAKIDIVLVCPVWPFNGMRDKVEYLRSTKGQENLVKGNLPGYHLLNRCKLEGFARSHQVVDFHNVYGVAFDLGTELAQQRGARLRLLPPYREHLSQAFARFFMRVGLPVDIDPLD